MKLKGNITLLCERNIIRLEVKDDNACATFLKIDLTPEQFCAALGRLSSVPCEIDVFNLGKIGKVHENKTFEFQLPKGVKENWKEREAMAYQVALGATPDGWTPDNYFGSQGSFFEKDGKSYARCTIRRWVDVKELKEV